MEHSAKYAGVSKVDGKIVDHWHWTEGIGPILMYV